MLRDLEIVTGLIEDVAPGFRRRTLVAVLMSVVFSFGIIYFQIVALEHQRADQSHVGDAMRFALAVLGWFVSVRYAWNHTSLGLAEGMHAITARLTARLRRLPLERFEGLGRGDAALRLTGDTRRILDATPALVTAPQSLARLAIGAGFALFVFPELAFAVALAMILMGFVVAAQMHGMAEGFNRAASAQARVYELLRSYISGATSIKQHRPRAAAIAAVSTRISSGMRELRAAMFTLFFERQHLANAILYSVLGLNAFILPLFISTDSESVREINLVLVWGAFSVIAVVFSLPELSQAADAARRLLAFEAQLSDEQLEPRVDTAGLARGRALEFETLSVRGLEFSYPATRTRPGFHVGPIDLELHRGEIVFLTGANGSGKSTFLAMLTALYPITGQLALDATPITAAELADYRARFCVVFTDHHLFAHAAGLSPDAEARAGALLEEMGIAEVTDIVDGRVTNRALSSGQKKRVAMVLARLRDRPILIFDEWAAEQDPEFRKFYYTRILPALKAAGKLVIAVTHDDQYFHCADRIIHFHAGRLAAPPPGGRP